MSRPFPIDRVRWRGGVTVSAYGRTIGVRVNRPELVPRLAAQLPCGCRPSARTAVDRLYSLYASRGRHHLYVDAEPLARWLPLAYALELLGQDARAYVAEHARRRLFVHAAVVGWKGGAIVIPGKTMSGKTTLAAAFVRAGATYYSDEYAVLDGSGRVHPYPKSLSIRDAANDTQTDCPVESLGGRAGTRPIPVVMVLVTNYRAGATWRPRRLSPGIGAMSLLANTFAARAEPARALGMLAKAVAGAAIYKSPRGEAGDMVKSVLASYDIIREVKL